MWVQVLGPVRLWRGNDEVVAGTTGQRAVLALLALAGGHPLSRAELVEALWRDAPPASAVNVIQTHVRHLRRMLEPDRTAHAPSTLLPAVGDGYALHVPGDQVDVQRFRRLTAAARAARQDDDHVREATLLGEALALWRAAPLADIPFLADHPKIVALVEERWATLGRYGEALVASGAAAQAVPVLEEAAAGQPLDEAAQVRLIQAYRAAGRRAKAFDAYHDARRRLADELGVDPGPELVASYTDLLDDGEPAGSATTTSEQATSEQAADEQGIGAVVPAQLPLDVPGFTGRGDELAALDRLLDGATGGETPAVVISAIAGTAGVGKTALAVRWAHHVAARFPDGQLHVDLRGYDPDQPVQPGHALAGFLHALGLSGQAIPVDLAERAATYRSVLSGRRMLILLDNASSVEQVRPLLPGSRSCFVVVTSRSSLTGLVVRHGASRLDLDLLPPAEAVALLRTLIGVRIDEEPAAAHLLAEQCARLPLALRIAAELAGARPGSSLADLVVELTDEQHRLDVLDSCDDPRTAVRAVFSWSYRRLPPEAARMFRLLGLHPGLGWDAPAAAALTGTSLATAQRLLTGLTQAHLLFRHLLSGNNLSPTGDRYGMHDLLRAYATDLAEREDSEEDRHAALSRLFDGYLYTAAAGMDIVHPASRETRPRIPAPDFEVQEVTSRAEALAWLDGERANLGAVVAYAAGHGWHSHATRLSVTLSRYLYVGSHYFEAIAIHGHALQAARRAADRSGEAYELTNLGIVYWHQGRFDRAIEYGGQALALHRANRDLYGQAVTLANLGLITWQQGNCQTAADYHQESLDLFREIGYGRGESQALNNLGGVYWQMGRYRDAAKYGQQSLDVARRCGDLSDESAALNNIGAVWCRRGDYDRALECHQLALTTAGQINDRGGEAYALYSLGEVYQQQNRCEQAIEHYHLALARYREGAELSGQADVLIGLGGTYKRQKRYALAIDHHRQALAISRENGARDIESSALNGLGEAVNASGEPDEALAHHNAALTGATATGNRYEQARAHAGLAYAYAATGDLDQARLEGQLALTIYTELELPDAETVRRELAALGALTTTTS
jgi:DNA-binding SARP family transcriptional activator/Tfp pilus assembly protein PilF